MKAEEVYIIAKYLAEKELEKLYLLLKNKVCKTHNRNCKPIKRKLITEQEATNYILKTVFKIDKRLIS